MPKIGSPLAKGGLRRALQYDRKWIEVCSYSRPLACQWLSVTPSSKFAPGVFYACFYNHARRLRLEKLLYVYSVDMCWPLETEEPHRSTILNLEHYPLKANASCPIFPLHQGKMSSVQPLSGLDTPSQGSRGQQTSIPPYHSPPSLSPFTIGKATRASHLGPL
jgi:hypothetical protein